MQQQIQTLDKEDVTTDNGSNKKWPTQKQTTTADAIHFFLSPTGVHYSEQPDSIGQSDDVRLNMSDSVHYQPAFYYPASWATGLLTITSQIPVSLDEKLDDVTQLWSPEEDGLYVGSPPKCCRRRWNILERRMVTATKTKWFRSDGSLSVLADPLRPYLIRNIIPVVDSSSVQFQPVYLPTGKLADDRKETAEPTVVHLFVSAMEFHHHWLFGEENVLAARLARQWAAYSCDSVEPAKMDVLGRKLRALYQAHDEAVELIERLQFNGADEAVVASQLQRIASYREAIGWTRGDYYAASCRRIALARSMMADWQRLKELRTSRGFGCTSCQLTVVERRKKKKTTSEGQDQSQPPLDWDEEIERQMDESRRLLQEHVRSESDRYKRQKAQWRRANRKSRKGMTSSSSESKDDDQEKRDQEKSETEPEAPDSRPFDEQQTRADIIKVMQQSLMPPGESLPIFSWTPNSTEKNPPDINDARELRRMEAIKKCVYQIKIFVNGQEIAVSNVFHLTQDFTADEIQQAFHLWIRDKPRNISIQLLYKMRENMKKWSLLANVDVPIPSARTSFAGQTEKKLKFKSDLVQQPIENLGSVGCGINQPGQEEMWTNGLLTIKTGWGSDNQGRVMAPKNMNHSPAINSEPWLNLKMQLDPNDPANAEALDKMEKMKRLEWRAGKTVEAVKDDDGDSFCSKEELDSNVRFQLLRRRADETKPFHHLTMIPSRSDEIPNHLINLMDGSAQTGSSFDRIEKDESVNPLDALRRRGQRKWLEIYQTVADRLSSSSQKRLQLSDLVMEDHIPDMSTFGGQLMPVFFKAHRPLRPERKERNPVPLLTGLAIHTTDQVSLRINVIRALNLPHKIDKDSMVRPFVEVSFQKSSARTTAGNGTSPTWNQELCLPVNCQEGTRSLAYLQSIGDDLFIQLFDQVVVDILDDDRQRDASVHQRYERHWLGGFKIPFQVVYKWNKIEGTFALNIPMVPIGYEYHHYNHDGPLLTVLISIHPAVGPPRINQIKGPSMEDQGFVEYVNGWRCRLVKEFPFLDGLVNPLIVNEKAATVYVGRYLTRLEPPEQLKGSSDEETLKNLCQFVAAIPQQPNNQPILTPRIWFTCQTVLGWLVGGDEERAVLLHNYLAALNYEVYVLLGMAVPEGETAFVLYRNKTNQTMRVINPSTGITTNVTDPNCAMQQVWALFNQNDFWVNIHCKMAPSQLQYQVTKTSDWRPLFSRKFPNPHLATIQSPESLVYQTTDNKDVRQLEESVVEYLKQSFMKWRKTVRTKWNRHAGQVFRDILTQAAQGDLTPTSENLQELLETYKVFGVPLKTAYVDMDGLSDLLYATGLHRHHGYEFGLAVFIKSYPNHLLHVFIFGAYLENL